LSTAARFVLPEELSATEPPEARGLARDEVRLLVATSAGMTHTRFRELPAHLRAGDLVLVNTSATLPAAVDGRREDGRDVVVHFSTALDDGAWVVELRRPDGRGPVLDGRTGERVHLPDGVRLTLVSGAGPGGRLWRARAAVAGSIVDYLGRHGRPITYGYVTGRWPLAAYQPVFGREPGSAEMPSAGRPFTDRLVTDLVTRGVLVAPVLLHTGVSSLESGEPPQAEPYRIPESTARLINHVRRNGGRVIAVGTTVTRAVESTATVDGRVTAGQGWTDLVLSADRPARVVDGIVTGWHEPGASHLLLLEAVAGAGLVRRAYEAALAEGYRWHEFGDSCLLLGERRGGAR
jgi:S-adenosylmethionine:tRNA ribosyltransferase-isomerase